MQSGTLATPEGAFAQRSAGGREKRIGPPLLRKALPQRGFSLDQTWAITLLGNRRGTDFANLRAAEGPPLNGGDDHGLRPPVPDHLNATGGSHARPLFLDSWNGGSTGPNFLHGPHLAWQRNSLEPDAFEWPESAHPQSRTHEAPGEGSEHSAARTPTVPGRGFAGMIRLLWRRVCPLSGRSSPVRRDRGRGRSRQLPGGVGGRYDART